ncbi:hypothetical protein [Pseudarthrobacter sp. C4D7]|uniref:hypothetical protein n=1 Tax=Pseudarthrobacter sp. C4D7 TaxID=2735268 RepID=UPI0015848DC2|nr:hypothetical protein [Pseudarthrobacter sp. C4D7]
MDPVTLGMAKADVKKKYAPVVRLSSPQPQQATSQAPSGRAIVGIFGSTLLSWSSFGLSQSENSGTTWTSKALPADVPTSAATAGAGWVVLFKGNYYLQAKKTSDGLPGIFRAAPVTGATDFTWSTSLLNGSTGSNIISTALAADANYIYWAEYGDPATGPSVWRSPDGTTWTKVLGPDTFAARHVHGIFPDPYNPGHVWLSCGDAGSAGYHYRSTNYGATWTIIPGDLGTNQAWQAVQVSFDADWIYFGPDTTSNFSAFKADRATLTPRWTGKQSHRYLPVPAGLPSRRITDLTTTSGSATITSATAAFTSADVGSRIRTTGQNTIPIDACIASVTNATTAAVYSSKAATVTGSTTTAILGGGAWGAMAYYGAVDPATGIYYFVSINGVAGGNVDGLFAVLPDGTLTLLDILTTSPDGKVTIDSGKVYVRGFWRPTLAL